MNRQFAALLAPAALLGAAALPQFASAQDVAGDRVNTVIIYGDDACPASGADEITVCARLDESERFRIPERLRLSQDPANEAWTNKVQAYESVGDFGPLSCSTSGMGGETGCTAQFIEAAYAERAQSSDVRFGQLIAEERAERLSTIDAEAAATQSRVEELERQYEDRLRREQEGEPASTVDPSAPPAAISDPTRIPPAPPSADIDEPFDAGNDAGTQPVSGSAGATLP